MKKKLFYLCCFFGLFQTIQAQDWEVCDIIESNHLTFIDQYGNVNCQISTKNIDTEILETELCVHLSTDEPNVEIYGGTCHVPFDSGVTTESYFPIYPINGSDFTIDCFTVELKLSRYIPYEDYYCIETFDICLNEILDINETSINTPPISVKHYDLSGREIIGEFTGMYIQKSFYEDGTIQVEKRYRTQ